MGYWREGVADEVLSPDESAPGSGLLPHDELEVFATGLQMGESPRWHDGRFWMCDWVAGEVLVFDADGGREVVARVEGLPFSIDWLPDGRLRRHHAGRRAWPATTSTPYGAAGGSFNEIVVDRRARATSTSRARCRGRSAGRGSSGWCRRTGRGARWPTTCGSPTAWR